MSQSRPDDVGSLLSQVHLDRTNYKVFRGESRKILRPRQQEIIANERESAQDLPALAVRVGPVEPAPLRELKRNSALVDVPVPPLPNSNWTGLDAALGSPNLDGRCSHTASNNRQISVPAVSLYSLSGGVGVTSLLAALARISARRCERALLLDAASPSLLPFYFGARSARSHISTFSDPEGQGSGVVHIASKQGDGDSDAADAWIWRSLASVAHETDVVFADVPARSMGDDLKIFLEQTVGVLVLVPDVRCLMSLRQIDSLAGGREVSGAPYLLLNAFEPSNSLHLEIQHRMATQFKDRLIPLTIRRDHHVSDALAHGTTVIDYAPESPVTEDLYRLAEWLQGKRLKRRATSAGSGKL